MKCYLFNFLLFLNLYSQASNIELYFRYKEVKKAMFFSSNENKLLLANQLAWIAEKLDSNSESFQMYEYVIRNSEDRVADSLIIGMFRTGLKSGKYENLLSMYYLASDSSYSNGERIKMCKYFLVAAIQQEDNEKLYLIIKDLNSWLDSIESKKLDGIVDSYKGITIFNEKSASNRSLIFPGLGQLYVKQKGQALNSFILVGALTGAMVATGFYVGFIESVFFWGPYWGHYYLGGARAAGELAIEKRKLERNRISNQILDWI